MSNDLVVLRDAGLYCPAGDFYIDPSLRVPRAVITHAHGDHAHSGMGHYWAAKRGEGLLRARVGRNSPMTLPAYGQAFQMGAATVSLHPAGHVLGSAQVRIAVNGQVWVVSGDYKRCADPSCDPFEVLPCHTFITEATFALPQYVWPGPGVVAQQIFNWWQQCKAEGKTAVLLAYALGKAQRVLAELLVHTQEPAWLHGAMVPLVQAYRDAGVALLPTRPLGAPPSSHNFAGQLILAPPGAAGTPWMKRFAPYSTGFTSGWMQLEHSQRRAAYDQGFVLSDHSDWPSLLRTIEETGAQRVLAMHGHSEVLVKHLRQRGIDAAELGATGSGQLPLALG